MTELLVIFLVLGQNPMKLKILYMKCSEVEGDILCIYINNFEPLVYIFLLMSLFVVLYSLVNGFRIVFTLVTATSTCKLFPFDHPELLPIVKSEMNVDCCFTSRVKYFADNLDNN